MKPPQLRMQEQACSNCRYFRIYGSSVECLLLGRTLAVGDVAFLLQSGWTRWCDGWKKLPKHWMIYAQKNPHWWDTYIPRTTLLKIRRRAGLLSKSEYEREVERTGDIGSEHSHDSGLDGGDIDAKRYGQSSISLYEDRSVAYTP